MNFVHYLAVDAYSPLVVVVAQLELMRAHVLLAHVDWDYPNEVTVEVVGLVVVDLIHHCFGSVVVAVVDSFAVAGSFVVVAGLTAVDLGVVAVVAGYFVVAVGQEIVVGYFALVDYYFAAAAAVAD